MKLMHYDTFRNIADGMVITMILYALLSYFKNKNTRFLMYSLILFPGLIQFYVVDLYYKNGTVDIPTKTYVLEFTCFNVILYCLFMLKMFEVHVQERYIYNKLLSIISILIGTIFINILLKSYNYNFLILRVYGLTIVICTILFTLIFYHLYQLKFLFMKYYWIGSTVITVGWILKCVFEVFPDHFPKLITFDNNNFLTFPNTYGELGTVFESIFMFIGISESHKMSELSNIDLKRKILLSIEEKSNYDKIFINIKQEVIFNINTTFNQHLKQSSILVDDTLQLLSVDKNETAKENLKLINQLSTQSILTIRTIVKEFKAQNQLTFNKSIESKAFEISKYHLSQRNISFDLYVNESKLWLTVSNDFEKQVLTFYEQIIKIFIKYKDFLHLMVNFAIHTDGSLFVIIQDDGRKIISKYRMIYELNQMTTQLLHCRGKIAHSIEDSGDSTVRLDFISILKNTSNE